MIELADKPVPTVTSTHEVEVSLQQFRDEAIIEYLRDRGFGVDGERKPVKVIVQNRIVEPGNDDLVLEKETLARVETLLLCGQKEAAREWILEVVGRYIGRRLT